MIAADLRRLHTLIGRRGVNVTDAPAALVGLDRDVWLERLARWLARQPQTARVRVARRVLARIRAQTREVRELVRELASLVAAYRPALLDIPGCRPLTAAN